jgi:hypothetical protein
VRIVLVNGDVIAVLLHTYPRDARRRRKRLKLCE